MSSIQTIGSAQYINVSRGFIPNASRLQKVGYSAGVTTSLVTVWNEAIAVVFPTVAAVLTVSSSSANDTAAGTGARTVTITGLDASFNQLTEVVTLNGQSAVSTVNLYYRINNISVTTAGSGGVNAGIIYIGTGIVTAGKPATIYNSMATGFNQSLSAFTTIPVGMTGYLLQVLASTDTAGTQVQIQTKAATGLVMTTRIFQLGIGAGTIQQYELPRPLTAGTDIVGMAIVASGTAKVSCQFELLLCTPS